MLIENFFKKIQNNFKKNFKIILIFVAIIISTFLLTQVFFYNKNNQILKTSIKFNLAKSYNSQSNFQEIINELSQEKNFYGVLATLEKINIHIKAGEINLVNKNYLKLLDQSKLTALYKSAIATHGAYSLLNLINNNNETEVTKFINNLLSYIDPNLPLYAGFKLEILYLLSVVHHDNNNNKVINNEMQKLYQQIQENDKISSSLKERVKKIHEYQKYK